MSSQRPPQQMRRRTAASLPDKTRQTRQQVGGNYHQREAVRKGDKSLTLDRKQSKLKEQQAALMKTDSPDKQACKYSGRRGTQTRRGVVVVFFFFSSEHSDEFMLRGSIMSESNLTILQPSPSQCRCRCHDPG